jgi:hypothetical protein
LGVDAMDTMDWMNPVPVQTNVIRFI